jgi:hypothetical protein
MQQIEKRRNDFQEISYLLVILKSIDSFHFLRQTRMTTTDSLHGDLSICTNIMHEVPLNSLNVHQSDKMFRAKVVEKDECTLCPMSLSLVWLSRYSGELRAWRPRFDYRQGQKIFLYSACRLGLRPTQSSIAYVLRALSPVSKAVRAWSWPITSVFAEVRNGGAISSPPPRPPYVLTAWYLIKYRENVTLC